jgi:hypothetical protein
MGLAGFHQLTAGVAASTFFGGIDLPNYLSENNWVRSPQEEDTFFCLVLIKQQSLL